MSKTFLPVGKVTGAFGVRGWLKIWSWTDPPRGLFGYSPLFHRCRDEEAWTPLELAEERVRGRGFIARPKDCRSRDEIERYIGGELGIRREQLPEAAAGEYYWCQLQGLRVRSTAGDLGVVSHLFDTGANDVMVVEPDGDSIDDRRRLIPWLWRQVVSEVDLGAGRVAVDWSDADESER